MPRHKPQSKSLSNKREMSTRELFKDFDPNNILGIANPTPYLNLPENDLPQEKKERISAMFQAFSESPYFSS